MKLFEIVYALSALVQIMPYPIAAIQTGLYLAIQFFRIQIKLFLYDVVAQFRVIAVQFVGQLQVTVDARRTSIHVFTHVYIES